jgi:predicted nucleic acid-binding protein
LFKHKDRLLKSSHLREADLLEALQALLSRLEFVGEANIPVGTWIKAYQLCREVDENDTPYVALCLHLEARMWTVDLELKTGLAARGFDRFFEG